jgi:hypothetical protein
LRAFGFIILSIEHHPLAVSSLPHALFLQPQQQVSVPMLLKVISVLFYILLLYTNPSLCVPFLDAMDFR